MKVCSINGCSRPAERKDLCKMHDHRLRRHGDVHAILRVRCGNHSLPEKTAILIDKKTTRDGECWIWTGAKSSYGYGVFRYDGKLVFVHRASYELYRGPIPEDYCVCHTCDNRLCANPDHLFIGTNLDNIQDRDNKNRQARGENNGNVKITGDIAKEILALYSAGLTRTEISKQLGVSWDIANRVIKKINWTHVG